jgi:hypothetical protein
MTRAGRQYADDMEGKPVPEGFQDLLAAMAADPEVASVVAVYGDGGLAPSDLERILREAAFKRTLLISDLPEWVLAEMALVYEGRPGYSGLDDLLRRDGQ